MPCVAGKHQGREARFCSAGGICALKNGLKGKGALGEPWEERGKLPSADVLVGWNRSAVENVFWYNV
jgi:hypothetical protein